jgi:hypothetical protein
VRAIYSLLNVHERVHHFLNIAMGLGSELAAFVVMGLTLAPVDRLVLAFGPGSFPVNP